ncbi:MAG TPA: hypothetical protein VHE55_04255 [Fimbriimonadaceae bacterium]|nr:hypothetical protein [Fimbriimonadaceae bacterium]
MSKLVCLWLLIPLLAGCGQGGNSANSSSSSGASAKSLTIVGPGGSVGIGDSLDAAKKAFPPPAGATTFDKSMAFAILNKQGWTWGLKDQAFEVALQNGKVCAIAVTGGSASDEPSKTISQIGEPTRKAVGKQASAYVWEAGKNARILLCLGPKAIIVPNGSMTLIGDKEDLKVLNYNADDPSIFVKQMDGAAQQLEDLQKSNKAKK